MLHPENAPLSPEPFDLDGVLARLRGRKRGLILTHDNPDPDSLAAAEGLRILLERELGISSTLALAGIIGRAENRAMVEALKIMLVPFERLPLGQFDLFALVDTQPNTGNNSLPPEVGADIVIDHHPPRGSHAEVSWYDVRQTLGASSTIVYQYLRRRNIALDARLATAFLYALKSETRDLGREATPAEREAYLELVALADHATLDRIAHPKVPRDHFVVLDRAIRNSRIYGQLLAVPLGALPYPDLVAEIADLMLPFEQARWVLCVGHHEGTVYLSIRTDAEDARAGELIRRVVGREGASGGHGMIAGGRLFAEVENDRDLDPVFERLVGRLCQETGLSSSRWEPMLPK